MTPILRDCPNGQRMTREKKPEYLELGRKVGLHQIPERLKSSRPHHGAGYSRGHRQGGRVAFESTGASPASSSSNNVNRDRAVGVQIGEGALPVRHSFSDGGSPRAARTCHNSRCIFVCDDNASSAPVTTDREDAIPPQYWELARLWGPSCPSIESFCDPGFCLQFSHSNAATHALGVVPNVCRKRATKAPGCW